MDTISSRESSGSPLPLVGVIAGLLGLVLGIVALVKVSGATKRLDENDPKIAKIEVKRSGVARRAKLYYLRDRIGKKQKLRERRSTAE